MIRREMQQRLSVSGVLSHIDLGLKRNNLFG
jgi:hypothetical protein